MRTDASQLLTATTRHPHAPAWIVAFLGALLAVLVVVFGAGLASAATPSAAENRVGASHSTAEVVVGSSANITAGQRLGNDPPRAEFVVATGVAANTGGGGLLSRLRAINWADDTGSISLPGNRLRPNFAAEGPHSTFRTGPDGSVTHYATWEPQSNPLNPAPWQMVKRVDVVGDPHFNKVTGTYVGTPHVQGPSIPGGVRPAEPWELP